MSTTTYSFGDVRTTIKHPSVGQYIIDGGEGVGSISVTMTTERTAHDIAADGSVMVSKIKGRNGMIALTMQQTSALNKWLRRWYNHLETAATDQWAETTIVVRSPVMGDLITATGVSPQKLPDRPYQAQGQNITWNLLCADIQQD